MMKLKVYFATALLFLPAIVGAATTDLDERIEAQRDLLRIQMYLIRDQLELDEKFFVELEESLKDEVVAAGNRIEAELAGGNCDYLFDNQLEEGLEKALLDFGKRKLSDSMYQKFEHQVISFNELRKRWDQHGQIAFISFVDETLSLSAEQEMAILKMLGNCWNSSWNEDFAYIAIDGAELGVTEVFELLKSHDIESILTDSQWKVFQNLFEYRIEMRAIDDGKVEVQKLLDVASQLMELRVEELSRSFQLSERQKKMLAIARKGAMVDLAKQWNAMVEKFEVDEGISNELEILPYSTRSLARQAISHKKWKSVLQQTFSSEQLAKIQERETHRAARFRDRMMFFVLLSPLASDAEVEISLQQYDSLKRILEEEIAVKDSGDFKSFICAFVDIDDSKFEPIYSDRQWEKLEPYLKAFRQAIREMDAE